MPGEAFDLRRARTSRRPVLAFDLGGTWFRRAVVGSRPGDIRFLAETPAISTRNFAEPPLELQEKMIACIVDDARSVHARTGVNTASVAVGAAVDMNTGHIRSSAPLWGALVCDLDLSAELSARAPEFSWFVLNDVTALAMFLLRFPILGKPRYAAAMTISTGVAYRTIDLQTGHIPVDSDHGLQGEIGHLPVDAFWRGQAIEAQCDCGAINHLSAFSSGRGLEKLVRQTTEFQPSRGQVSPARHGEADVLKDFAAAVADGHSLALEVLDLSTAPVAKVLAYQMTLNPEVRFTIINGGVPIGIGSPYLKSLVGHLVKFGYYGMPSADASYFLRRLAIGSSDGLDGLRGAAIYARGQLPGRPEIA